MATRKLPPGVTIPEFTPGTPVPAPAPPITRQFSQEDISLLKTSIAAIQEYFDERLARAGTE